MSKKQDSSAPESTPKQSTEYPGILPRYAAFNHFDLDNGHFGESIVQHFSQFKLVDLSNDTKMPEVKQHTAGMMYMSHGKGDLFPILFK